MDPEQRQRARAIFAATREMTPEERARFRQEWERKTPEQRREWLRTHPVPARP